MFFLKEKGVAILTVIVLGFFLFWIGYSLLWFIQGDYNLAGKTNKNTQAFYAAMAGLVYANDPASGLIPSIPGPDIQIEENKYFNVIETSGYFISTGKIQRQTGGSWRNFSQRKLKAPKTNINKWVEISP